MKQLILCKGIPASGKSTFSKAWVQEDPHNRIRVCRDDIRRMLGPYWLPQREHLVTQIETLSITTALINDYSVIVDAMNFRRNENDWKNIIRQKGIIPEMIDIQFQDFTHVPLEECIKRDSKRKGDEKVGKDVMIKMYNRFILKK